VGAPNHFQFNPTSCNKTEVTGTIKSAEGETDALKAPFQMTDCEHLKFEPKVSISTRGKTSKAGGASLTYKVTYPNVPSRLTTLPYSALAANGNLRKPMVSKTVKKKVKVRVNGRTRTVTRKVSEQVAAHLQMPSDYIAQNGATYKYTAPITVTECPKPKPSKMAKTKTKAKRKLRKKP
jgi:hypothetical protein